MKQPWINNVKTDLFILAPPFLVVAIVFLFQNTLTEISSKYGFFTWLFLIVFVDVAHVYSTLFKTYLVKKEFQKRKTLYLAVPVLSLLLGIVFYQFGSLFFWSALALVAVYHFVRQQYGFMRLYARFEPNDFLKRLDTVAVYAATVYPMLYWMATPRSFNWFVDDEFNWLGDFPDYLNLLTAIYFMIIAVWIAKSFYVYLKFRSFNIPKNAVIIGTFLSWYFGIVYFNNDLIFTFLNVISHGIPYMALIYINEIEKKDTHYLKHLSVFKSGIGVAFFIAVLLLIAFSEEFLWEILVWKENISISAIEISDMWLMILVPLLTVPQLTHYLLDGFIWKTQKK